MQQLRSIAVQIRNAADAITRDGMTGTILAEHIAETPWSRSPLQQQLAPKFMIRALVTSANPEALLGVAGAPAELQQWVTHYTDSLPATLDELAERIQVRASEAGSPPLPVTGIDRIELLRE